MIPPTIAPLTAVLAMLFTAFSLPFAMSSEEKFAILPTVADDQDYIDLGAGCFWCVEAVYQRVDGIKSVTSGYMGGTTKNPTYTSVIQGNTNHVEVVRVVFDPQIISTEHVLEWFWKLHDPTTLNRQGNDVGTQYRSAIFYHSNEQKKIVNASKDKANPKFDGKIVTEINKGSTFYPAEVYHQDYYNINGNKNPYCRAVIPPKLKKLNLDNVKEK